MTIRVSIASADGSTEVREVEDRSFTIGRGPDNLIVLADPQVSTRHADVVHTGGRLSVRDNQSRNGTFINHELLVGTRSVDPDDEIEIGDCILKISYLAEEALLMPARPLLGPPELDLEAPRWAPPSGAVVEVQAVTLSDQLYSFLENPGVHEVLIRGGESTRARPSESGERRELVGTEDQVEVLAATLTGTALSAARPMLEVELDAFDLHAFHHSVTAGGCTLVFLRRRPSAVNALDSIAAEDARYLREAVTRMRSILVCGGSVATREAFVSSLAREIPGGPRRVVLYRSLLDKDLAADGVALRRKGESPELVRAALRLDPDVLVAFELTGSEAAEALGGSRPATLLWSLPAAHAEDALGTLEAVLGGRLGLAPGPFPRLFVTSCLDIVIVVETRRRSEPAVASIFEVREGELHGRGVSPALGVTDCGGPR